MRLPFLALPFLLLPAACGQGESEDTAAGVAATTAGAEQDQLLGGTGSSLPADQQAILEGSADPLADSRLAELPKSRSALILETDEIDLGVVFQQHDVPLEIPFKVEGPDPIYLVGVGSTDNLPVTCGCTDAHVRADWMVKSDGDAGKWERWDLDEPIPPGAEGTIVAEFHGNRYNRVKTSEIMVRGNMANGEQIIDVRAEVKPIFVTQPAQVNFGRTLAGGLRTSDPTVEVMVTAMGGFEILRWKHLPAGVTVETVGEPVALDGERVQQKLRFTLDESAAEGTMNGTALAETSLGFDYEVLLSATVMGAVKYKPETRLMFGFWDAGEARTRTVRVELQISGATLPEPVVSFEGNMAEHLSAEIDPAPDGRAVDIKVTAAAETPPGSYNGVIHVAWPEDSGLEAHQLTVKAVVREKE